MENLDINNIFKENKEIENEKYSKRDSIIPNKDNIYSPFD